MTEPVTDRKGIIMLFAVMAMAFFLDGLDGTIVAVALPDIGRYFGMTMGDTSWILTVYFMAMAGLILVFGRLADKGMLKRILVCGFLMFALGSLLCAVSSSAIMLLASRGLQGIGSAMLAATGVMIGVKHIPVSRRNLSMSLTVLGSSVGAAFGPALGGVLTEYLSWQWIFIINVPVGIVCACFALKAVPSDGGYAKGNFDIIGSILLVVMLVCGLYSIETVPTEGFTIGTIITTAVFAFTLVLFIVYELRREEPVLNLRLFSIAGYDMAMLAFLLMNMCFMGILYLLPFMMQVEMGLDTIQSSLMLLIQAAATLVLCIPAGRASDAYGPRRFAVAGCIILAAVSVVFALMRREYGLIPLAAANGLFGCVWGIAGGSIGPRIVDCAPPGEKGPASSMLSFIVYFGCALGTALFSVVFSIGSGEPATAIADLGEEVFMDGFIAAMVVSAILSAVAAVVSYILRTEKTS